MKNDNERKGPKCPWCGKRLKTKANAEEHERQCPKRPVKYEEDK